MFFSHMAAAPFCLFKATYSQWKLECWAGTEFRGLEEEEKLDQSLAEEDLVHLISGDKQFR